MKKYYKPLAFLLALSMIFLSCCKDDDSGENDIIIYPVANFSILGGNEPAPHKVFLSNTSTGATTYSWDFGDGVISYQINPEHIYDEGGTYTISLTAFNGAIQDVLTKTITILNRPTQVEMIKLTLTGFPETNNDTAWDTDSPPDVYFEIQNNNLALLYTSSIKYDLQTSQLPAIYSAANPFVFTSLSTTYYIKFSDYDELSNSENMGGYYFPINVWVPDDGMGYPSEIIFESESSQLKFLLTIEWIN